MKRAVPGIAHAYAPAAGLHLSRRRFVQRMAELGLAAAGVPLLGGCGGSSSRRNGTAARRIGLITPFAITTSTIPMFIDTLPERGHTVVNFNRTPVAGASAPLLDPPTFADQEMYARWLRAQAAALQELAPATVSDAEMYQRWRQAQPAPVPDPVSHPDWN